MSLNIGLSPSGSVQDADYAAGLSLEDDGYYWFLYPYFESVWKRTGQMVDLYGDAIFKGDHLPVFRATLSDALQALDERPPEWAVRIGLRGDEELLRRVTREALCQLLTCFISLTDRASQTGMYVVCLGD